MSEQLEVSHQTAHRLRTLSHQAQKNIDEFLSWLLDSYTMPAPRNEVMDNEPTWTEAEIAELLKPEESLTGKEMVEQGFIGGWEDMGIEDPVQWLEQQKARKRKKYQW